MLGVKAWLRRPGANEWEVPFLDVDCSQRADMWVTVTVD
jgi:hypothetical protein